jgi:hypothetical protein
VDQPPLAEVLLVLEPPPVGAPAVLTPESLTEVATRVPPEFFTPWMTTESPGWSEPLETPTLLVSLVVPERVTLTVLPLVSVR